MILTDEEINELLERFDQTDAKLQRRIIARFVQREAFVDELLAACKAARGAVCGSRILSAAEQTAVEESLDNAIQKAEEMRG